MQFLTRGQTSNFDINTPVNKELTNVAHEQNHPYSTPPTTAATTLPNSEQVAQLMSFWAADELTPQKSTEQARALQLPPALREKMEGAFDTDFSDVHFQEDDDITAIGARAVSVGKNVTFAPGYFNPDSIDGQARIGEELYHIIQKSQGRVSTDSHSRSLPMNHDHNLENEAKEAGRTASQSSTIQNRRQRTKIGTLPASAAPVIQKDGHDNGFGGGLQLNFRFGDPRGSGLTIKPYVYYAGQHGKLSTEAYASLEYSLLNKIYGNQGDGRMLTLDAGFLAGKGGNTNLLGSSWVGGAPMYNPKGSSGFNGGGLGFTWNNILDPKFHHLSNLNWNLLGRFSNSNSTINAKIREDYPFSDKGDTGLASVDYYRLLGQEKMLHLGYRNQNYTDQSAGFENISGKSPDPSKNQDPSKNKYSYYDRGVARNFGINELVFGLSQPGQAFDCSLGLEGGKQGAFLQNTIHDNLSHNPRFRHDASYFGKPYFGCNVSTTFPSHR